MDSINKLILLGNLGLKLSAVRIDGGIQMRETLNAEVVGDYGERMKAGDEFPPVTVFYDGADYWLADGFHRLEAAKLAGLETIAADARRGTRRDAILYGAGANVSHGLRRTNADKRRAVSALLNDPEWSQWSDREIARRCAVSHPFVSALRETLTGNVTSEERRFRTKYGTEATMDTSNIGALADGLAPLAQALGRFKLAVICLRQSYQKEIEAVKGLRLVEAASEYIKCGLEIIENARPTGCENPEDFIGLYKEVCSVALQLQGESTASVLWSERHPAKLPTMA
jgi:hypothetical protein